ncbi:disintegrin and metalloproteinase domain-containing protein 30-like [Tachyglossus aculeatus]|uniref:disintegrin and metalloproteinase domain-containing protein 30-like n=1 Tax=Tachyglossus aculeatus TaxID=9261 RepID=UPI0018F637B6|nr:disintegrin and metalloproteinase domain-containing protein 30-like [Tachyglossus aculeatus]
MRPSGPALLLLGLGYLLAAPEPDPWGFSWSEVVIPRRLTPRLGEAQEPGRLTYLLPLDGRRHVLHLRPKQLLLPRRLPVFTFTARGELVEEQPPVPHDCYYRGAVEGAPDSLATFSTCFRGLWGMLRLHGRLYQVEPLPASATFEHRVSRLVDRPLSNLTCGLTDKEIARQATRFRPPAPFRRVDWHDSYIHSKYVELAVAVDNTRYRFRKSNLSAVIRDTIILVNFADSHFQELKARIFLKALEVWTDRDKVNVRHPELLRILEEFLPYQENNIYPRVQQDLAHLFVLKIFPDALGWAYRSSVCDAKWMGSISSLPGKFLFEPSLWFTHELGHGCGMAHDDEYCTCKGLTCIMKSAGLRLGGFSNCSFADFFFTSRFASCLNNIPGQFLVVKTCGNKVVEWGEECDCGSERECEKDACCLSNCRLSPDAECASGLCCKGCQFVPARKVCRPRQSECDLDEFCNGTSSVCPEDVYKQDGTPCSGGAICYHGGCRSHLRQCRALFGKEAVDAPLLCYEEVNGYVDRFGNCGLEQNLYKKCAVRDMLCGRVQCVNVKMIPSMPDHTSVIQSHAKASNTMCWGTDYHVSMHTMKIADIGDVKDGSFCGLGLICINRTCLNVSLLNYDCEPEKCNHRGVCNNKRNCHCDYGWAPPFCETPGDGGSIDSGPPGKPVAATTFQVWPICILRIIVFVASLILASTKLMKTEEKAPLKEMEKKSKKRLQSKFSRKFRERVTFFR